MGEWQVEDKHQMMADKEATRMNRLISSIEDHTVSEKGDYSSEHDEHLTPEQREEARLNKRFFLVPSVTQLLCYVLNGMLFAKNSF